MSTPNRPGRTLSASLTARVLAAVANVESSVGLTAPEGLRVEVVLRGDAGRGKRAGWDWWVGLHLTRPDGSVYLTTETMNDGTTTPEEATASLESSLTYTADLNRRTRATGSRA